MIKLIQILPPKQNFTITKLIQITTTKLHNVSLIQIITTKQNFTIPKLSKTIIKSKMVSHSLAINEAYFNKMTYSQELVSSSFHFHHPRYSLLLLLLQFIHFIILCSIELQLTKVFSNGSHTPLKYLLLKMVLGTVLFMQLHPT